MSGGSVVSKVAKTAMAPVKKAAEIGGDVGGFVGNAVGGNTGKNIGSSVGGLGLGSGTGAATGGVVGQTAGITEAASQTAGKLLSAAGLPTDALPETPGEDTKTKAIEASIFSQTRRKGRAANMLSGGLGSSGVKTAGRTLLGG